MDGNTQPTAAVALAETPRRTCLLVLGMHRSGTSALTRVLSLTGAALPANVMGAALGNETGHWEPKLVQELNDELLKEVGSSWDDWRPVEFSGLAPHRRFHYKSAISKLLEGEYADARLFVLKEPRVCRLVPIYLDVLRELDVEARILIPFRNPIAVAGSLETRNGLHPQISELYWIRHVLDAERDTRGLTRTFLNYDSLVADWRATIGKLGAELDLDIDGSRLGTAHEIDNFLSPDLRHHKVSDRAVERSETVSDWAKKAFAALKELEKDPHSETAQEQLDDVRDRFDRSVALFGTHFAKLKREREETEQSRALLETQLAEIEARLTAERQAAAEQIASLTAHSEQIAGSLAAASTDLEETRASLSSAQAELQDRELLVQTANDALDASRLELQSLNEKLAEFISGEQVYLERLAEADSRLESVQAENASVISARDGALAEVGHLNARLSLLEEQVREAHGVIQALRSSTSWKVTRPLRALKRIRARLNERRDLGLVRESGLFDKAWYIGAYRDVDPARIDPLLHFIRYGGFEGRNPSPHFDSRHYLITNRDVAERQINPLVHYLRFGRTEMRAALPQARIKASPSVPGQPSSSSETASWDADALRMDAAFEALSTDMIAQAEPSSAFNGDECKLIAFYLPQFHRVRENSEWWSPGFTEWTNVARGRPNFEGHYQPHIPRELGYYDLSSPATLREQADMARLYGVSGFCFYHYWFSGRRILERPVQQFLESDIDLNFCLCWANENWTRTWDGDTKSVLLAQEYGPDDALAFITDILPALKDRRYIQVDGKPLLLVYRAKEIPDARGWFDLWRKVAAENGLKGLHIAVVDFYDISTPGEVGADSLVEFPPHKFNGSQNHPDRMPALTNPDFAGGVVDYVRMIVQSAKRPVPDFQLFRGIIPSWDNTARRQNTPTIILNARPDLFGAWLTFLRRYTRLTNANPDRRLVFINAWNEWGEGCHLEPDMKWGLSYLEETLTSSIASATEPAGSLQEAAAALQFDLACRLPAGNIGPDMPEDVPPVPADENLKHVTTLFQDHEIPAPMVLKISGALRRWPRVHAVMRQSYRRLRQLGRSV